MALHALAAAFQVVEMAYPAVSVLSAAMALALPAVAVAAAMVPAVAVAAEMVPAVAVAAAMVPAVAVAATMVPAVVVLVTVMVPAVAMAAVMVPVVVVAFLVLYHLLFSRSFGAHFHDQKRQGLVCCAHLGLFLLFHLCHDQRFFLVVCLDPGAPPA